MPPSFFKTVKPRGFQYTPRYYDPRAEELKNIVAQGGIEGKLNVKVDHIVSFRGERLHRGTFRNGLANRSKNTNIRFFLILTVLLLLVYYLIFF